MIYAMTEVSAFALGLIIGIAITAVGFFLVYDMPEEPETWITADEWRAMVGDDWPWPGPPERR